MKRPVQILMLCSLIISNTTLVTGQAFFKTSSSKDLLAQKVAFFSNGDMLIATSSTASVHAGDEVGTLLIVRIDFCGNQIWSKSYDYEDGYLVLKDIAVNDDDAIFMYGSHFKGLTESIFLTKLEAPHESRVEFRIYDPGSVDHFTFSMDIKNNQLALYGLLFDFNTSKEGFVAYFDSNLNIEGGFKFTPFESTGHAVISNDGGIVGRSGPYIYRFNSDGDLVWGFTLKEQQDIQNISGPFQVGDNWVFEGHNAGESFLYGIGNDGTLAWMSDLFKSTNLGGSISEIDQNRLLYTYNLDTGSGTELRSALLQGAQILQESVIDQAKTINTGVIDQYYNEEHIIIIGSNNLMQISNAEIENFVLKYPIQDLDSDCFTNDISMNSRANDFAIRLEPLQVQSEASELELLQSSNLNAAMYDYELVDICSESDLIVPTREEKLLPCAEDWIVSLPSDEYKWVDGYVGIERPLSIEGLYTARKIDCLDKELFEFLLEKEDCGCEIYLPNSFSPNNDGINDQLELGLFCDFTELELSIFNQWGERVFQSESNRKSWSGNFKNKNAPAGVYAAILNYTWTDNDGTIVKDKIVQSLTLLR